MARRQFPGMEDRMRMPFPSSISQKLREGLAREEGGSRSEKTRAKQSKDMATG